eukprot:TRINITY_DN37864_c0_g1_i1.p1 TRINITY_DN37864_c0_g1~~TRINITY_DN37864_c0_g1_i1.p1  ORF type:complete len:740 (+),score=137.49 TRINITY_DN37864_c0_g1_i1:805-3024(+)
MERSYRDPVLLRYGSQKSLGNPSCSPKLRLRNSDVDFSDVFGGPPRCSMMEKRHSTGETVNSLAFRGGKEAPPVRKSWPGLSEKPVFGGDSPNHRRQLGSDFFDDIFRGEDSVSTTAPRDPFSSMPASQTLSPARPLPPKVEQLSGGSSQPPLLGLSSTLAKGIDYSTFSTPCRSPARNREGASSTYTFPSPRTGLVRVTSEMKLGQDCSRYDSQASFRQSPLSRVFSSAGDGLSNDTRSARQKKGSQFSKDRSSSEVSSDSSQFHFSIYKWASKGVTLMMPSKGGKRSNSKERGKNESIVSGLPAPVLQGVNLSSLNENMSTLSTPSQIQYDIEDNSSSRDLRSLMKDDIVEEPMPSKPEAKPLHVCLGDVPEEPGRSGKLCPSRSGDSPHIGFCNQMEKEECQPKLNLECPLSNSSDEPGKGMVKPAREEIGMPKLNDLSVGNVDDSSKVKKWIGGKIIVNHAQATGLGSQDAMLNSEGKMPATRAKGKVKEFVKIFDQEASPKLTSNGDTKGWSSRRIDLRAVKTEDLASFSTPKTVEKETLRNGHNSKILANSHAVADQSSKQTRMARDNANICGYKIHDSSSELNGISESCSETMQEGSKDTFGSIKESHGEDLHVNCLVELLEELQTQQQTDPNQDEIQISDAKIQQWSHGKEGNIRSLLSTLQYVLWPESGWKPVPLVDIIEGTSVKRAYQKALLCLHPDKLQQKSAPVYQKHTAEKVFGILQEAWDHFSSL